MRTAFRFAPLVLLLAACRTLPPEDSGFRPLPTSRQEQLQRDSERLGNGILQAFRQGDFAGLRRNTPGELAERVTERDFRTSLRNFESKFGKLTTFKLLTALDTPAFCNLIYVTTFVRPGTQGDEIRRQLLFRVVTFPADDRVEVASYGFL
ncbi:MAG: hypothetical protein IJJ28_08195 [Lentisphaeria bacterium]|nr:hypothetical protein [Lentisphaeria bacterium]